MREGLKTVVLDYSVRERPPVFLGVDLLEGDGDLVPLDSVPAAFHIHAVKQSNWSSLD